MRPSLHRVYRFFFAAHSVPCHPEQNGRRNRDRTCDPSLVRAVLSQLSYPPEEYFYTICPRILSIDSDELQQNLCGRCIETRRRIATESPPLAVPKNARRQRAEQKTFSAILVNFRAGILLKMQDNDLLYCPSILTGRAVNVKIFHACDNHRIGCLAFLCVSRIL